MTLDAFFLVLAGHAATFALGVLYGLYRARREPTEDGLARVYRSLHQARQDAKHWKHQSELWRRRAEEKDHDFARVQQANWQWRAQNRDLVFERDQAVTELAREKKKQAVKGTQ